MNSEPKPITTDDVVAELASGISNGWIMDNEDGTYNFASAKDGDIITATKQDMLDTLWSQLHADQLREVGCREMKPEFREMLEGNPLMLIHGTFITDTITEVQLATKEALRPLVENRPDDIVDKEILAGLMSNTMDDVMDRHPEFENEELAELFIQVYVEYLKDNWGGLNDKAKREAKAKKRNNKQRKRKSR